MNRLLIALLALIGLVTLGLILYIAYVLVYAWALFEVFSFPFRQ